MVDQSSSLPTGTANTEDPLPSPPTPDQAGSATRQLLGMKGAKGGGTSLWKIRLQLMKPITWIPLIWGVVCGAASSGQFRWNLEHILLAAACMLLAGPLLTGYTQTLNDYYDRDIDAINEPYRPIPSGAITVPQVVTQILVLLGAGLGLAYGLDRWANHGFPTLTALALGGALVSFIYSAPPLKLKQNGWLGNYALGASYIALPWWAGHALFGDLNWRIVLLTLFYSLAGLGIAVVNDFKSVEGDRQMGLKSLPVMFGVSTAAWICVLMIDIFQGGIAAYLIRIHQNLYAVLLVLLLIPQITFQDMYFLRNPLENDVKYQASAQPFLVLGMLVTGLALGQAGI
ncbi:MAG TPA: chlorophyll synthase ChlG [Leptolyngbyaceae cyanobacterium M65_K2018_010]|nr:chlorophyll synthase ChlG [Leptolyngbyaceae cyanobacterium M65_K2018_010]